MYRKRRRFNKSDRAIQIDIDYDKLADAIVKAQKQAEIQSQEELEQTQEEKGSFWKNVWNIIWNKGNSEGRLLNGSVAILLSFLFRLLFWVGLAVDVFLIHGVGSYFVVEAAWNGIGQIIANIIVIVMFLMLIGIIAIYSLLLKGAANEIEKEKDKNYVIAVFSGIVGLAALIVAIIALVKQVP